MDTLRTISDATPTTRERYVDLLRALSIGVVVIGHWLVAVVALDHGRIGARNALAIIPGLWMLTWILQVMPLFFFVGGFSNLRSWRSRGSYAEFVRTRFARLLTPTIVFAGVWLIVAAVLPALGVSRALVEQMAAGVAIPLWFMAVYLIVILLAPFAVRAHERYGVRAPIALLAGALTVDVLSRAFGVPYIGWLNFVFVWMLPHQLGFFYASIRPRAARVLAIGGLATVAVLTMSGLYAGSMVGVPGASDSNNSPPTFALAMHGVWLIGLAMSLRPAANRWLARARVWRAVVGVNAVIMTLFLWHMTALVIGAVVLLPLGFPQPSVGSTAWWLLRPVWIVALGAVLAAFVRAFGRIELSSMLGGGGARRFGSARRVVANALVATVGMCVIAQVGFASIWSIVGVCALVTGWRGARGARVPDRGARGASAGGVNTL